MGGLEYTHGFSFRLLENEYVMGGVQDLWNTEVIRGGIFLLLSVLSYYLVRLVLIKVVHHLVRKSKAEWDDILVKRKVFSSLALLAPAIVLYYGSQTFPLLRDGFFSQILSVYVTIVIILFIDRVLSASMDIYDQSPVSARHPLKGYVQLFKIFVYITGAVVALAVLGGVSPWKLVSGIGALTAVLLLIFKDTILSFVASIQIAGNDLMRKGDWIQMDQFGANGEVIDIALHTVKVQNWDKTITSIPTNKFLDNSFKNWRGMFSTGGRRIMRSILIDQSSIRFMDEKLLEKARNIRLLKEYTARKEEEIAEYNRGLGIAENDRVSQRKMTNIGTLRAYIKAYLKNHPKVRQDMIMLVRHLQPKADSGLPLEVYCFTTETAWADYEDIQADIFDHILSIIPEFGLRAYQRDALTDRRTLAERGEKKA